MALPEIEGLRYCCPYVPCDKSEQEFCEAEDSRENSQYSLDLKKSTIYKKLPKNVFDSLGFFLEKLMAVWKTITKMNITRKWKSSGLVSTVSLWRASAHFVIMKRFEALYFWKLLAC